MHLHSPEAGQIGQNKHCNELKYKYGVATVMKVKSENGCMTNEAMQDESEQSVMSEYVENGLRGGAG